MAEQSGRRPGPTFLGHPNLGYGTAFLASIGILSALRARHLTGRGPARRRLAARRRGRPERHELVVERARRVVPGAERDRAGLRSQPDHHRPLPVRRRRVPDDPHRRRGRLQADHGHPRRRRRGPDHQRPGDGGAPRRRGVPRGAPAGPQGLRLPASRRVGEAVPRGRPGRAAGAAPDRGPARRAGAVRRRGRRAPRLIGAAAAPGRSGHQVRGFAARAPGAGAGRRSRRLPARRARWPGSVPRGPWSRGEPRSPTPSKVSACSTSAASSRRPTAPSC